VRSLAALEVPASATRYDLVQLGGGLDLLTPPLKLRPGVAREAVNWEQSITGGYARIAGYERTDGRLAAPSLATYTTLTVALSGAPLTANDTITGATSGATGLVLSLTGNVLALTKNTGAFVKNETITVAGVTRGTITELGGAGPQEGYNAAQIALAANAYRADIQKPAGAGPIRGGWVLNGINYCARNNAGNTALVFHKATVAGWVAVPFKLEVAFTLGTSEYVPGETITQGGVSSTVRGVSVESGSWLAGTAAGHLVIDAPTGGNFAAGVSAGGGGATLGGAQTQITLAPGGRVETDQGNFGGGVKVYGTDGVNGAWEFDGTTLVPIRTGNTVPPKHPLVHKDHLFLAFGSSLQHSGITTPFNWTVTAGAAEYRCDSEITALTRQPGSQSGGAMSIGLLNSTEMLYGNSAADFSKVSFEQSGGARPYGTQRLGGQTFAYGDTGVMSIAASQQFGNFSPSSLTMNIRPFTQVRRSLCAASLVNREKSQYRVFFSDAYALYMTIVNGRLVGTMPIFFPEAVNVAWQGLSPDGQEVAYIGGSSGYVYTLDAGTSFDGVPIAASVTLTFANQGNARIVKRYRGAQIEVQGDGYAEFKLTFEVGYGTVDRSQGNVPSSAEVTLASVNWDEFTWDEFTWDGRSLAPTHAELSGSGENIALRIESESDAYLPFTLNSVVLHYSQRKALKS
jgi:hypothetical protein